MADAKLYLGDCVDIMRTMPDDSIDLVLADPPYPGLKGGLKIKTYTSVAKITNTTISVGTPWDTSLAWMDEAWRISKFGMMVFCSFHSVDIVKERFKENAIALITWYKRNSAPSMNNVPHYTTEFIWVFKKTPGLKWRNLETFYDIPGLPGGCMGIEREKDSNGKTAHPTQKPLILMKKLLRVNPKSVIDPFCGTGTTAVACLELGIDCTAIEILPEYYKIAERRIQVAQQKILLPMNMES